MRYYIPDGVVNNSKIDGLGTVEQRPQTIDSTNVLTQQSLKNILIDILHKHTAYDCLPVNSSINSVDKTISLYDAINILIHKDLE